LRPKNFTARDIKLYKRSLLEKVETMERNGLKNWLFNNNQNDEWMLGNLEKMQNSRTPQGLKQQVVSTNPCLSSRRKSVWKEAIVTDGAIFPAFPTIVCRMINLLIFTVLFPFILKYMKIPATYF
jgi:hypothetical protein